MAELFGKLIELLSKISSPRTWTAVFLFSLILVLFPSFSKSLPILGLLASGCYLVTYPIHALWKTAARYRKDKRAVRTGKDRLHNLTHEEKKLLQSYLHRGTRTRRWNVGSGVVGGLVQRGILSRSSQYGSRVEGFAYEITDWALEYLKAHPELVATPGDTTEPDAFP